MGEWDAGEAKQRQCNRRSSFNKCWRDKCREGSAQAQSKVVFGDVSFVGPGAIRAEQGGCSCREPETELTLPCSKMGLARGRLLQQFLDETKGCG
jgi:hypothetical protein